MKNYRETGGAFTLVEVALALGIAAFALITIFGLLPVGLDSNQSSIRQSEVANILSDIIADLRSTPTTATVSPRFGISLAAVSATNPAIYYLYSTGGTYLASTALTPTCTYRIAVSVVPPATGQRTATNVGLVVSWPASIALPSPSASPSPVTLQASVPNSAAAFVALDRN